MIVDTCWGHREIGQKNYWHVVPSMGPTAAMFYNNVAVGKGALLSASAGIRAEPHLENAQTPYSYLKLNDAKEAIFETVRKGQFPEKPSRLKSIYLFDDQSLVERALREWFPNEAKAVHECNVLVDARTHQADTTWLNCLPAEWEQCARKYWAGVMSESPFTETIVDGAIYFPKYRSFPSAASFLRIAS